MYRRTTWTQVCRDAGLEAAPAPSGRETEEAALLRRVSNLAHVDDLPRLDAYTRLVSGRLADGGTRPAPSEHDLIFATMLFFTLWPDRRATSPYDGLAELTAFPAVVGELLQVWDVARQRIAHVTYPLDGPLGARTPLRAHARYSREEMLAGIGWAYCGDQPRVPKGHAAVQAPLGESANERHASDQLLGRGRDGLRPVHAVRLDRPER